MIERHCMLTHACDVVVYSQTTNEESNRSIT